LNISAALLAFLALRGWTRALERLGFSPRPFTRQENTVVQTCAVACYTIAFGGTSPGCSLCVDLLLLYRQRVPFLERNFRNFDPP
ncbi:hypothetical protein EUU22_22360, partial [Ciceribacter ferrooxidans]